MSDFKDAIAADVKSTFINFDEFGSYHYLNGVKTLCILDKDISHELDARNRDAEGVFLNTITLYVSSTDIVCPVKGELMKIDGSFHIVQSVADENGVYVVVCEENQQ